MPRPTGRLGDEFETDRLESQKDLGVMENAGENAEKPHSNPPLVIMRRSRQPSVPRLRSQPTHVHPWSRNAPAWSLQARTRSADRLNKRMRERSEMMRRILV